jgi:hypothetical protein
VTACGGQVWGSDDQRDIVHVQRLVNPLPRASMAARVANKRQGHWVNLGGCCGYAGVLGNTTHQHTYTLPTNLASVFPVCVVGAVTGSPIGWAHSACSSYCGHFDSCLQLGAVACRARASSTMSPAVCTLFFPFKAFPSFGSPLALLGLHPKEPVNGNTCTMLITV